MSALELLDEDAEETLLTDDAIERLISLSAPGCFFCLFETVEGDPVPSKKAVEDRNEGTKPDKIII